MIFFLIILTVLAVIVIFFTFLWWQSRKQPPAYGLIVEKYYVCRKYKLLHGGIFGKGPTKFLFQETGQSWCWRKEWEEIERKTFKKLASDWYSINWAEESAYWQND